MTYKVDLDPVQHVWVASVEAATPEPRVLLRNDVGTLEHCLEGINNSILRHALNPWSEGKPPHQGERAGDAPLESKRQAIKHPKSTR